MSNWNINNHITGKVYDLTQENMNAMIADVERLREDIKLHQKINTSDGKLIQSLKDENEKLRVFFSEFAESMCGIRTAVDYMATRDASAKIHQSNIDYFKKLDEKLFELDNTIFSIGNFENGKFVFKALTQKAEE